jgi:acetyl-CoA acetyltransferase
MNPRATIAGVGLTSFGKHPGQGPLDLMSAAAHAAMDDAGVSRGDIDGLITGYATTLPHLMLANVFAEHFGLAPRHVHAAQSGGATGAMMLVLARHLIAAGAARTILVVAGENRLTGQTRDQTIATLAQVGHPRLEVPTGASVPAYYALIAARYLHETGATEADLAALAVLMRRHATSHPGAQIRQQVSIADVLNSKPIATPLKLLDCCPISDGGAALIVTSAPRDLRRAIDIVGVGEGHTHQHVFCAPDDIALGARHASRRAFEMAGMAPTDIDYLAVYDSFTATLALLLEATGFAERGQAGRMTAAGVFDAGGALPLNTHGGLLAYGHCGVGGAMAHVVEAVIQMRGAGGARQIARRPSRAFVHADGGVLSAHASLILARAS